MLPLPTGSFSSQKDNVHPSCVVSACAFRIQAHRVVQEEIVQDLRDAGPQWVGKGSLRIPPCPGVARADYYPVLLHLLAVGVVPTPLDIGVAQGRVPGDDL